MSWAGLLGSVIGVPVNSDLAVVRAGLAQRRQSRPGADRRPGGGGLGRKLSPRAPRGSSFGRKNTGLSEASLQKTGGAQSHALIFPVGDTEVRSGLPSPRSWAAQFGGLATPHQTPSLTHSPWEVPSPPEPRLALGTRPRAGALCPAFPAPTVRSVTATWCSTRGSRPGWHSCHFPSVKGKAPGGRAAGQQWEFLGNVRGVAVILMALNPSALPHPSSATPKPNGLGKWLFFSKPVFLHL